MSTFNDALEHLLNEHSIENESDTPDYILALYIRRCLNTWNETVRLRDGFYGIDFDLRTRLLGEK